MVVRLPEITDRTEYKLEAPASGSSVWARGQFTRLRFELVFARGFYRWLWTGLLSLGSRGAIPPNGDRFGLRRRAGRQHFPLTDAGSVGARCLWSPSVVGWLVFDLRQVWCGDSLAAFVF